MRARPRANVLTLRSPGWRLTAACRKPNINHTCGPRGLGWARPCAWFCSLTSDRCGEPGCDTHPGKDAGGFRIRSRRVLAAVRVGDDAAVTSHAQEVYGIRMTGAGRGFEAGVPPDRADRGADRGWTCGKALLRLDLGGTGHVWGEGGEDSGHPLHVVVGRGAGVRVGGAAGGREKGRHANPVQYTGGVMLTPPPSLSPPRSPRALAGDVRSGPRAEPGANGVAHRVTAREVHLDSYQLLPPFPALVLCVPGFETLVRACVRCVRDAGR